MEATGHGLELTAGTRPDFTGSGHNPSCSARRTGGSVRPSMGAGATVTEAVGSPDLEAVGRDTLQRVPGSRHRDLERLREATGNTKDS